MGVGGGLSAGRRLDRGLLHNGDGLGGTPTEGPGQRQLRADSRAIRGHVVRSTQRVRTLQRLGGGELLSEGQVMDARTVIGPQHACRGDPVVSASAMASSAWRPLSSNRPRAVRLSTRWLRAKTDGRMGTPR